MSGIFKKKRSTPMMQTASVNQNVLADQSSQGAVERSEERAAAQEETQMRGMQRRRRLRRSGGMRLLFSPLRMEGPAVAGYKKLLGG